MKLLIKRVIKLIKPYFHLEIIGFLFTVTYSIALFGSPIVSRYLIDDVMPTKSLSKLYCGIGIFLLVCISQPVFGFFKDLVFLNITEQVTKNLRKNMTSKIINAPLKFFDKSQNGDIISRILNDGRSASEFISSFFVVIIKDLLIITMVLCGMFYMSVKITSIIMLIFVLFFLINWRVSTKFRSISLEIQKNYDAICTKINHMVKSIVSIKSFLVEERINKEFNDVLSKAYVDNKKMGYLSAALNNLTNVIVILSLCMVYGIGTLDVMYGRSTLGTVIAIGLYFQLLVQPVFELMNSNFQLHRTIPIFDRIYEYLEIKSEDSHINSLADDEKLLDYDSENKEKLKDGITIRNLSFSYEDKILALNKINLQIPGKGMYAFVGKSGAGKSTLVKILMGFYRPLNGVIFIGSDNLLDVGVKKIREKISFVPQEVDMFNCSIKENIRIGNENSSDEEIIEICKRLKLHEKIMSLPEGYDSMINERVNLSGGEKQRIAIARALVRKSTIFIFDEPTSALDPENETIMKDILKDLSADFIVIVIAHKINTIINADKIFLFEDGHIMEQGTHEELVKQNGRFAKLMYNCQKEHISQESA